MAKGDPCKSSFKWGGLKTPALRSTACFDRIDWDYEYRLHAGSSIIVVVRRTIKVRTHFTRSGLKGVCAVSWVEEEQQWCNTCDLCLLSSRFKHLMLALNSNLKLPLNLRANPRKKEKGKSGRLPQDLRHVFATKPLRVSFARTVRVSGGS